MPDFDDQPSSRDLIRAAREELKKPRALTPDPGDDIDSDKEAETPDSGFAPESPSPKHRADPRPQPSGDRSPSSPRPPIGDASASGDSASVGSAKVLSRFRPQGKWRALVTIIAIGYAISFGVGAYNETRTDPPPEEAFAQLVEEEYGNTLTEQDLSELKAWVVVADSFATCGEFITYFSSEIGEFGQGSDSEMEGFILGGAIAAFSDGVASGFVDECLSEQSALNLDATDYGDDATLDQLWDQCESGVYESCDLLFLFAASNSAYETFGAACGKSGPEEVDFCIDAFGDGVDLDGWRDRCHTGDHRACDLLYEFSPVGSADEQFAQTCGGTAEQSPLGCIFRFGL